MTSKQPCTHKKASVAKRAVPLTLLFTLVLGACNNEQSGDAGQISAGELALVPPAQLMMVRAIERARLTATATVNGSSVALAADAANQQWTGTIVVPENQTVDLAINWLYDDLPVATHSRQLASLTRNTTIALTAADYTTDGTAFDFDTDGYSNLSEIDDGFDPRDSNSPGAPDIDVIIPWVSPTDAPTIDGLYDNVWNSAQFRDREGNELLIDNLMRDLGATLPNGNTGFRWAAMHDDAYLYLFVFAESISSATPRGDSTTSYRDDNLNLFLDGDNSKLSSYDNVDDRHFLIPFLQLRRGAAPNDSFEQVTDANGDLMFDNAGMIAVNTGAGTQYVTPAPITANRHPGTGGRFETGDNSVTLPTDFEFANCLCTPEYTYEIKINLAQSGIVKDRPFGIGVQLDDDNTGGNRNARYGWVHPARSGGIDTDRTWENPSFMGTAIIR